ncbi:acyl-CoA synthetase (AMP-forming)/AMP-acid ligase II [Caldalkalibacillus uzonensis]|uniref:Acyl-CoA synthetase (AMP-forming)/AMP-acid ligase II n=1 Tax=Caldalkalibacillus uzonensis TaxID=353224 RepID=A0ABU0CLZ4_9BACI|nr:long-chain fatty acid--CoA ligase [Caldalkalibacillus uzonensis]MDQ0337433.1 acyl-CoA synthetase (AMP-forming)/AMP-acid ligase II [Caldalkalibacillus uzonensis]
MNEAYSSIKEKVRDFILQDQASEEEFNQLALSLFAFQYEHNQAFRKFCRKRRVSPVSVKHFTEIPAVPINAFKEAILSACPIEEAEAIFMTSGTTNPAKKGKHYHRDLDIYDLSMQRYFKPNILPDREQIKMAILFPPEEDMPNSSLAHYLRLALDMFGTEDSRYVVQSNHFDLDLLIDMLRASEQKDEPVLVIGATFSFIHFLDHCKQEGLTFKLPQGSRVMDTGGAKGRSREILPHQFKQEMSILFSIPEAYCVNMYGMTELSSQFYDQNLYHAVNADHTANQTESVNNVKVPPHWVRTLVIDPVTYKPKPCGEQGIIVHYDLANLNSVLAIMTEDMGRSTLNGFELLGRATGAEAKGCSLAVEEFLASRQM